MNSPPYILRVTHTQCLCMLPPPTTKMLNGLWNTFGAIWKSFSLGVSKLLLCSKLLLSATPFPVAFLALLYLTWIWRAIYKHNSGGLLQPDRFPYQWCLPVFPRVATATGTDKLPHIASCSCFYGWGYAPFRLNVYDTNSLCGRTPTFVSHWSFCQMLPGNAETSPRFDK